MACLDAPFREIGCSVLTRADGAWRDLAAPDVSSRTLRQCALPLASHTSSLSCSLATHQRPSSIAFPSIPFPVTAGLPTPSLPPPACACAFACACACLRTAADVLLGPVPAVRLPLLAHLTQRLRGRSRSRSTGGSSEARIQRQRWNWLNCSWSRGSCWCDCEWIRWWHTGRCSRVSWASSWQRRRLAGSCAEGRCIGCIPCIGGVGRRCWRRSRLWLY